jgi:hypothetical protein
VKDRFVLRQKALLGMQSGKLPTQRPSVTWGGVGSGAVCAVCDVRLSPDDVEIEFEISPEGDPNRGAYTMHLTCHAAWEAELPVAAAHVMFSEATTSPRGSDVTDDEVQTRTRGS